MKKEYIFGLTGLVIGALVVLIRTNAVIEANKASMMKLVEERTAKSQNFSTSSNSHVMPDGTIMKNMDDGMSMEEMTEALKGKNGDEFDKAFIEMMIPHHQGAIDMAELALKNANHQEIKDLSSNIINAQDSEIKMMQNWQMEWGYKK